MPSLTFHYDHINALHHPLQTLRHISQILSTSPPTHLSYNLFSLHLELYRVLQISSITLSQLSHTFSTPSTTLSTSIHSLLSHYSALQNSLTSHITSLNNLETTLSTSRTNTTTATLSRLDAASKLRQSTLTAVQQHVELEQTSHQAAREQRHAETRLTLSPLSPLDTKALQADVQLKTRVHDRVRADLIAALHLKADRTSEFVHCAAAARIGMRAVNRDDRALKWCQDVSAALEGGRKAVEDIVNVLNMALESTDVENGQVLRVALRFFAGEMNETTKAVYIHMMKE